MQKQTNKDEINRTQSSMNRRGRGEGARRGGGGVGVALCLSLKSIQVHGGNYLSIIIMIISIIYFTILVYSPIRRLGGLRGSLGIVGNF